jgi:Delta6-protoilludene synthase
MTTLPQVHLPDVLTLVQWPTPRKLNQHYVEVKLDSDSWLRSFGAFDDSSQKAFDKCNFGQLVACL